MNNIIMAAMSFILFFESGHAQTSGTLVIRASNFNTNEGMAIVLLFRIKDDIPEKPFMKSSCTIVEGHADVVFQNVPYGEYAAILFHDENSNDHLDHRFGFPSEPMGFSNRWKLTLFSGMPNFEKLKFAFEEGTGSYAIQIR